MWLGRFCTESVFKQASINHLVRDLWRAVHYINITLMMLTFEPINDTSD